MSNKAKVNTIIDSSRLQGIENWMGGPKQGNVPVPDVDDYIESEEIAKQSDPPGSVKAVAKARRRAFEHGVGIATAGLTAEALFAEIARLAPLDKNRHATSADTVRRVFKGIIALGSTLEPGDGE